MAHSSLDFSMKVSPNFIRTSTRSEIHGFMRIYFKSQSENWTG